MQMQNHILYLIMFSNKVKGTHLPTGAKAYKIDWCSTGHKRTTNKVWKHLKQMNFDYTVLIDWWQGWQACNISCFAKLQ